MKIVIFETHVTLTLTSDDLESHIVVYASSTLTNSTIWFVAALSLIVDGRTYKRTDILPGLLGHLSGDDLKIENVQYIQNLLTNFAEIWHDGASPPFTVDPISQ